MNFFEQQDIAKRNTTRLVLLLVLAVISLIVITTLVFVFTMLYMQSGDSAQQAQVASSGFWSSLGTVIEWRSVQISATAGRRTHGGRISRRQAY